MFQKRGVLDKKGVEKKQKWDWGEAEGGGGGYDAQGNCTSKNSGIAI